MTVQVHKTIAKATRLPNSRDLPLSFGIAAILCLALIPMSPDTTWGQTGPVPSPNRRGARAPANRDTEIRSTPADAVTPEYSSPEADHAVTGLRSRTTTPTEEIEEDLPWQTDMTRRLWQNRILAPDPSEDAETRAVLNDLIHRIRSVRFDDDAAAGPTFSVPTEPAPIVGPARAPQPDTAQPTPTPVPTTPAEPAATLTEATLKKLEDALHDPSQVADPLEMAELLFLSGRRAEATVFYERALARTTPNDRSTENDRAWILFQLGNCLRQTDMTRARDMYMKLVAEYPASPWTELAKAHGRLITWYQSAKPQQFMPQQESQ